MSTLLFRALDLLDKKHIHYKLERTRADTIQINVTFVGARVEIEIFEDGHLEMSRFLGDESVDSGSIEMLEGIIEDLS